MYDMCVKTTGAVLIILLIGVAITPTTAFAQSEDVEEPKLLCREGKLLAEEAKLLCEKPDILSEESNLLCKEGKFLAEEAKLLCEKVNYWCEYPISFCNSEVRDNLIKMLLISVLAGVNYTALGWIKKFRRKAVGEDVPIHWGKFGRAVALGTSLGLVFFVAMMFEIIPVPPLEKESDLAVWFAAATGGIIMVDRWLIKGSPGSGARAEREAT